MLIYRGVRYHPSHLGYETLPNDTVGVYRGVQMQLRTAKHRQDITQAIPLTYRGVRYYATF